VFYVQIDRTSNRNVDSMISHTDAGAFELQAGYIERKCFHIGAAVHCLRLEFGSFQFDACCWSHFCLCRISLVHIAQRGVVMPGLVEVVLASGLEVMSKVEVRKEKKKGKNCLYSGQFHCPVFVYRNGWIPLCLSMTMTTTSRADWYQWRCVDVWMVEVMLDISFDMYFAQQLSQRE
jgi:hypothetical protein